MSEEAIILSKAPDFRGLRLIQNLTGHVHSPWFTFEWRRNQPGEQPYDMGGKYHEIQAQAKAAFAAVLGIKERELLVSSLPDPHDPRAVWWRLGTVHPVTLPKPKLPAPTARDAIDI